MELPRYEALFKQCPSGPFDRRLNYLIAASREGTAWGGTGVILWLGIALLASHSIEGVCVPLELMVYR